MPLSTVKAKWQKWGARGSDDIGKEFLWLEDSDMTSKEHGDGPLQEATSGAQAVAQQPAFVWGFIPTLRTVTFVQALFLAALAAAGALVAMSGGATIGLLVLSRMAAPAHVCILRPLPFHYEGGTATALAALVPELDHLAEAVAHAGSAQEPGDVQLMAALQQRRAAGSAAKGDGDGAADLPLSPPPPRFLAPGEAVTVSVALALPPQAAHTLLQVTGELLTAEGRLLARRSATWLAAPESRGARLVYALLWPLYLLRLGDDSTRLALPLFSNYSEPAGWGGAVLFRARLSGRTLAEGAPSVYRAQLVVRRLLGWRQRLLAALTPGPLLSLALVALGSAMLVGGGATCAACALAAYVVYAWGSCVSAAESKQHPGERARPPGWAGLEWGSGDEGGGVGGSEDEGVGGWGSRGGAASSMVAHASCRSRDLASLLTGHEGEGWTEEEEALLGRSAAAAAGGDGKPSTAPTHSGVAIGVQGSSAIHEIQALTAEGSNEGPVRNRKAFVLAP